MKTTKLFRGIALAVGNLLVSIQPATAQTSHYKYQVVQRVCQQLTTAFGEHRTPKLTLITDPASQRIAQFVPKPEAELFIDEKLYGICQRFGADSLGALAIILGHELTHYYGKHADWFGFAQLVKRQQPTIAQAKQTQVLEAEADIQGVYRAFLAGYDAYRLAEPLYRAIYTAYHLPDQMTGYPSREERIRIMDEQAHKANALANAFDVGVFFLLKREYTVAQRCFEFVSADIPAKELLNNIGLCQLLRATQAMSPHEMPFRYPFEVETGNRLRQVNNRGDVVDRAVLLKQAISYFQQAIDLDNTYTTAYTNQASALLMLGRTGTAKETVDQLEEALLDTQKSLPPNARLIRGIALIEAGNVQEGSRQLEQSNGAYELAYNLDVARQYAHLTAQPVEVATQILMQLAGRYAGTATSQLLSPEIHLGTITLPFTRATPFVERIAIPEPELVRIQTNRTTEGILYQITLANSQYDVICSQPSSAYQSGLGIKSGSSVLQLISSYGEPQRVVFANGLTYYCYDSANFFVAIQDRIVKNWFIYFAH